MPNQIDLKPAEYREKGRSPIRKIVEDKVLLRIATVLGFVGAAIIWAGVVTFPLEPWWLPYLLGILPGGLFLLWVTFRYEPSLPPSDRR